MCRKSIWCIAVLFCQALWAAGQFQYIPNPAAGVEFSRGEAALKIGNIAMAIESYRKAVILDPDWPDSVSALIGAVKTALRNKPLELRTGSPVFRSMRELYLARAAAAPNNALYQWAVAAFDDSPLQEMAERYYRSAIAIEPKFIKAYEGLAATLSFRGDLEGERECLNKLRELQPGNMDALALHAQRVLEADPALARKLTSELLKSWHHPAGADLLSRFAAFDGNLDSRIATLEQLKAWYPASENDTTEWHMRFLFDAYNRTEPFKALALAQEMIAVLSPRSEAGRDWLAMSQYQQSLTLARSLMERKSYQEAAQELKMAPPFMISATPQAIMQAQALELAGKSDQAYQIAIDFMARRPSDELAPILARCAEKRKRTGAQVEADLWAARIRRARKMPDFELPSYGGNAMTKLSQFRGRVVLLDFWHPGSITARDDLPHIKRMYDKYEARGLTVITINTEPVMYVAAVLMKRYPFVALRASSSGWASKEFGINTAPYYLLLDRDGRALYTPQFGSFDAQRSFELAVEALLAHKGK
jgi:peroxiredoxin